MNRPFHFDQAFMLRSRVSAIQCLRECTGDEMRFSRRLVFGLVVLATGVMLHARATEAQSLPWMNTSLSPEQRAALLVPAMTLDEKIEQIAMNTGPNPDLPGCGVRSDSRHIEGIPRLAIPTIRMTNGPIGVAGGDCDPNPPTTGVPTALAVAASWDPRSVVSLG